MRLPSVKPRQVMRVFKKAGFEQNRQTGSHLIMVNRQEKIIVPVPMHAKEMKRGLLAGIIKQSGLNRQQFLDLL